MRKLLLFFSLSLTMLMSACATTTASPPAGSQETPSQNDQGEGQEVRAVVRAFEPRSYTDNLEDGSVLVSDIVVFAVLEPPDLTDIVVSAYYRGQPKVEERILKVGDVVRFKLPKAVQRDGIPLSDLKELHFDGQP